MKQNILEQIYYGRFVPWNNRNDKTPEMRPISEQINNDIESLKGLLENDGNVLLERLLDNCSELECQMVCEGFKDGFRFGVQIMLAAIDVKE